jgi:hypothetical protein
MGGAGASYEDCGFCCGGGGEWVGVRVVRVGESKRQGWRRDCSDTWFCLCLVSEQDLVLASTPDVYPSSRRHALFSDCTLHTNPIQPSPSQHIFTSTPNPPKEEDLSVCSAVPSVTSLCFLSREGGQLLNGQRTSPKTVSISRRRKASPAGES